MKVDNEIKIISFVIGLLISVISWRVMVWFDWEFYYQDKVKAEISKSIQESQLK